MSSLHLALQQLPEPTKTIGNMLIEFYDTMKALEKDAERGGKQATKVIMTISDFETLQNEYIKNVSIEFNHWCCDHSVEFDLQEEKNHSVEELYHKFKSTKELKY